MTNKKTFVIVLIFLVIVSCHRKSIPSAQGECEETGIASYYGGKFIGKPTASGEIYDATKLTAAHKKLPFGTKVKVTNLNNNKSVVVRINDRGPFVAGRMIDLSEAAAQKINMIKEGVVKVTIVCE